MSYTIAEVEADRKKIDEERKHDEESVGTVSDDDDSGSEQETEGGKLRWSDFMKSQFAEHSKAEPKGDLRKSLAFIFSHIVGDWNAKQDEASVQDAKDGKIHWTAFMKEGFKYYSASGLTPSEVLQKIGEDWKTVPENCILKEVRGKRKRSTFSPGEALKLQKGETLNAFNGARDKLEVYRMAGEIMKKKNEGKHRERYILPITQEKRQHMLRLVRAADKMITDGTVKTHYDALSLGFSIPYSLMTHEA